MDIHKRPIDPRGFQRGESLTRQRQRLNDIAHDAAQGNARVLGRDVPIGYARRPNWIMLKNTGTIDIGKHGVVEIGSPINTAPILFEGSTPSADDEMILGIAMEPISVNQVGRVAVSGDIVVKVDSAYGTFAAYDYLTGEFGSDYAIEAIDVEPFKFDARTFFVATGNTDINGLTPVRILFSQGWLSILDEMKDWIREAAGDDIVDGIIEFAPDGDWSLYEDLLNGIKYGMRAKWTQVLSAIRQTVDGVIQGKFTRVLTFEAFSGQTSTGVGCTCPAQCSLHTLVGIQDAFCEDDLLKIINETYYVAGYDAEGALTTIGVVESCPGVTPAQSMTSQARDTGCGTALTIVSQIGCDDDEYLEDPTAAYYPRVVYFLAVGRTSGWLDLMACALPVTCPSDCSAMAQTLYVDFPVGVDCGTATASSGGTSTLVHDGLIAPCSWDGSAHTDNKFEVVEIVCTPDVGGHFWQINISADAGLSIYVYTKSTGNTPLGVYEYDPILGDACSDAVAKMPTLEVYE